MNDYDEVMENGLWLEDQGSRFSRYEYQGSSIWLDHLYSMVIEDPSEAK
jgi:hypothetical protein